MAEVEPDKALRIGKKYLKKLEHARVQKVSPHAD
jgi:hypothetical protein